MSNVKFDRTSFIGIFRLSLAERGIGLFNIRFHAATLKNRDTDSGCGLKNRSTFVRVDSLDTVIAVDAKGREIFRLRGSVGFACCLQLQAGSLEIGALFKRKFERLLERDSLRHLSGQIFTQGEYLAHR